MNENECSRTFMNDYKWWYDNERSRFTGKFWLTDIAYDFKAINLVKVFNQRLPLSISDNFNNNPAADNF